MKTLSAAVTLIIALIISSNLFGQAIPNTINYQGVLKDAIGNFVPDGNYNCTFSLFDTESGGTQLWSESKPITVEDGIFSTQLGSSTQINLPFDDAYWLEVNVEGTVLTPRSPFTSVPYSRISLTVPDNSITSSKISSGQVVKSLNSLKDNVNLVAGSNITITPAGQNITISSSGGGGGIGGSGSTNYLPKFTGSTSLGNSMIFQSPDDKIGIGTSSPQSRFDILGISNWDLVNTEGDLRIGNSTYRIKMGIALGGGGAGDAYIASVGGTNRLSLGTGTTLNQLRTLTIHNNNVGIGTIAPFYPFHIITNRRIAAYFSSDSVSNESHVVHVKVTGTGTSDAIGIYGQSMPSDNFGIGGYFAGGYFGVQGFGTANSGPLCAAVYGTSSATTSLSVGVYGWANGSGSNNYGVYGRADNGGSNYAGYFFGNVAVIGTLSKGGGSFKIDHPLDPANKYLYHSFVESPDMMNIYNGNVITDASGYATIDLPDWFEALNKDFRYQLTAVGDFAQVIVSQKIQNNHFIIQTDKPGIEVSWQVTGIRKDAFAEKNRIPVEELKQGDEKGKYLYPEAFDLPENLGIDYSRNSGTDERTNKSKQ